MKVLFIFFSLLFSIATCQQLINLSSFKGGNVKNQLNGGKKYGIFVSALADSSDLLQNISVVQEDGEVVTLEKLKNLKASNESGELKPYVVSHSAYVTTNLTIDDMEQLTGVMYLCTPNQLNDIDFHVIDVSIPQTIDYQELGAINSTIIFLNTGIFNNHYQASIISQWTQPSSVSVFMYTNIPTDTVEAPNTQIFSNPMHEAYEGFFSNVEKFGTTDMVAFYLKTFNGSPKFKIEPGYHDLDGTTTTAFNTTGLIMNQIGWQDDQITFYTMRDEQYSGSVGANVSWWEMPWGLFNKIVGNLSANGEVTISVYGDFIYHDFSTPLNGGPIVPWSAPTIGQTFEAFSNVTQEQYYVQFFVRQGQLIPVTSTTTMTNTTTPPSTSTVPPTSGGVTITGNVETTTNSSGTTRILFLVALTSFIVLLPNRK